MDAKKDILLNNAKTILQSLITPGTSRQHGHFYFHRSALAAGSYYEPIERKKND